MNKNLAILFFFCAFISNAQNTLNNVGLTSVAPASVAYSVRQLSTSYAGPLVRIKVGTSFYDLYPDASTKFVSLSSKISAPIVSYNAAISVASANALSTIITSSTDATVSIWYDQSGNGVNVLTSTTGPKIITQGSFQLMSGKPSIYFAPVSANTNPLVSATTVNYSAQQTATVNAVAQNVGSTSNISGIYSTGLSGGWGLNYSPTTAAPGYWLDGSGCNQAFSGTTSTTPKIVTGFLNKTTSTSIIYENSILMGTKPIACNISNGTTDNICVGIRASNGGVRKFDGFISEVILFPSILSSVDQATLESNQNSTYFSPNVIITSSATNNTSCSGASLTFTATPYNFSTAPSYQWYKNSVAISGATSATYTTTTLSNNDAIYVSCSVPSNIVSDNSLALWLDASNTSSYSSGSTWYDLSGNGRNATINSHQTFSSVNGGAFQFDGTANPMLLTKVTSATSEISMSAWVYITPGTTQGAFIKNGATLGNTFGAGGGNGFCAGTFPGMLLAGQSWLGSSSPTANFSSGWQLCTMVISGSSPTSYKYYINGTLANTATFSSPLAPDGSYTALGDNYGDGGGCTPFNSKMGAAYFYTKALSVSEILQNYNASASRFGLANIYGYNSNTITTTVNSGPSGTLTALGDGCINKTTLSTVTGQTSYAWYKDNVAISGATSNTYVPTIAGDYKVQVSNGTCATTSNSTTISTCGVTADGRMSIFETSTTIVSKDGAKNIGKGISETGKILTIPFAFGTVTSAGGRVWMDRNLGASQVATNSTDVASYGDLYEWGRVEDGHQLRTASTTNTQSSSDTPGNSLFIYGSGDWRNPSNNNLWQGLNGINNPCPSGFRIPTKAEWETEMATWTSQNDAGAFASPLKLPNAGFRNTDGNVYMNTTFADYWTSTVDGANAGRMFFYPGGAGTNSISRAFGFSCRCIQD